MLTLIYSLGCRASFIQQQLAYAGLLGELVFGLVISQVLRAAITNEDNEVVLEDYLQLSDCLRFIILYYCSRIPNKQRSFGRTLEVLKRNPRPSPDSFPIAINEQSQQKIAEALPTSSDRSLSVERVVTDGV